MGISWDLPSLEEWGKTDFDFWAGVQVIILYFNSVSVNGKVRLSCLLRNSKRDCALMCQYLKYQFSWT